MVYLRTLTIEINQIYRFIYHTWSYGWYILYWLASATSCLIELSAGSSWKIQRDAECKGCTPRRPLTSISTVWPSFLPTYGVKFGFWAYIYIHIYIFIIWINHIYIYILPSCQHFVCNYNKKSHTRIFVCCFQSPTGQWKKTCLFRVFRRMKYYQLLPSYEGIVS